MPVDLIEAESSNITKIGYDPETKTLYVKFKGPLRDGPVWSYADVPQDVYQALTEAQSVGKYFAAAIRPFYKATKITEEIEEKQP